MRTTLTLEDDVARRLERYRESSGESLKAIVNRALRAGFDAIESKGSSRRRPYRTRPHDPGSVRLPDVDDVAGVLAAVEGEGAR
jgi:hypothetical protein